MKSEEKISLKYLIFKNTGYQLAGFTVTTVVGFIITAVLSRYLGVEGFGQYNYIFAFYMFFMTLNDFGVNTIVVREVSKNREDAGRLIGALLLFKLGLALLSVILAWMVITVMQFPAELRRGLYLYSLILPILALQLPSVMFQVAL